MSDTTVSVPARSIMPWWVTLIQAIAAVVIGGLLMFQTVTTTVLLTLFFGWWWLISGIFEIGSIFIDRTAWGWRLFTGLLSIVAGAYIIGSPLLGTVVVVGVATLILGINGMIIGVIDIIKAFQGAGWGKGLLGTLSFVIGAVIAFNFTSFMLALPWVWGVFMVAGGVAASIVSFQQRTASASMKSSSSSTYNGTSSGAGRHEVPKCLRCGAVNKWKKDGLFLPRHFVIGLILLLMGILPGILYFVTIAIIRSGSGARAKICPTCGARNMWTFQY